MGQSLGSCTSLFLGWVGLVSVAILTWGCRCQPRAGVLCPSGFPSPSRSTIGEPNLIQIKTKRIRCGLHSQGLLPAWEMHPPSQTRAWSRSGDFQLSGAGGPPSTHPQGGFRQSSLPSQFCPGCCFQVLASLESWKRERVGHRARQRPWSCPAAAKAKATSPFAPPSCDGGWLTPASFLLSLLQHLEGRVFNSQASPPLPRLDRPPLVPS